MNGSVYLEVRHGLRFLDFEQSSWTFSLSVKDDMLRFVSSSGHVNSTKNGSILVSEGGRLCEMISQIYFSFKKVQLGLASVVG